MKPAEDFWALEVANRHFSVYKVDLVDMVDVIHMVDNMDIVDNVDMADTFT